MPRQLASERTKEGMDAGMQVPIASLELAIGEQEVGSMDQYEGIAHSAQVDEVGRRQRYQIYRLCWHRCFFAWLGSSGED